MSLSTTKSLGSHGQSGFALIITVVLVAFLVLILVGLATFTRVETQVATNSSQLQVARQNALTALNIAIGELQRATGSDQRVTAPAEATPSSAVLADPGLPSAPSANYNDNTWDTFETNLDAFWSDRSPHWTGVWRNASSFPATSPKLVNWLVSGNEQAAVVSGSNHAAPSYQPDMMIGGINNSVNAAFLNPTINGNPAIALVGNFSVSSAASPTTINASDLARYVVAPKVDLQGLLPDGTTGVIGRYAWWVGDQGTKATVDAASAKITGVTGLTASQAEVLALQQPARVGFDVTLPNFEPSNEWAKVLTYGQMVFGPTGIEPRDVRARFHDYGVASSGLLVDLRNGGFRTDLTNNPNLAPAGSGLANYTAAAGIPSDDLISGDLLLGGSGPNSQSHPDLDRRGAIFNLTHPFRGIEMDRFQPVVAAVRVSYQLAYNGGFVLTPRPELMLWNPYNADFEWVEAFSGDVYRNGYRYRVRLSYNRAENGNAPWDGQVSISGYWSGGGPGVLPDRTTVDTVPLNLFVDGLDDDLLDPYNTPAQPRPDPNKIRADFLSEDHSGLNTGSTAGRLWRLRAGDVALLRGNPMQRDSASAIGGTAEAAIALPNAANAASGNGTDFYGALDTATVLHYSPSVSSRVIGIEVFARPIDHQGDDVDNGRTGMDRLPDGPSVDEVKEYRIFNASLNLELADFNPSAVANANPVDQPSWGAAWRPNTPPAGFFSSPVELIQFSAPSTIAPNQVAYVVVGYESSVLDNNFWTDYMQNDPRTTFGPIAEIGTTFTDYAFDTGAGLGRAYGELSIGLSGVGPDDQRFPVIFEIPRVQPVSVGELMHIFPTASNQSPHLLGLDPNSLAGGVVSTVENLNRDAWDSFFFSTITSAPPVSALDTYRPINTRLEIQRVPDKPDSETHNYLDGAGGRPEAVALRVRGAFNLNSPSAVAWDSVLNSAGGGILPPSDRNLTAVGWDQNASGFVTGGFKLTSNLGRFTHAPGVTWSFRHEELNVINSDGLASLVRNGQRSLEPLDFYNRLLFDGGFPQANPPSGSSDPVIGRDGRTVSREFSRLLTLAMKRRVIADGSNGGPFLSIGDFVNSGVLQYAIDNVSWSSPPSTSSLRHGLNHVQNAHNTWRDFSSFKNVSSYLSQREIMKALAPALSARSDTFVIRTYGEVVNPTDATEIVGRAWCEALVQRNVDYVDPTDNPQDTTPNAINQEFGRRYRIIAFRWLDANDI